MYIVNQAVTITFVLPKTGTSFQGTSWDISIENPFKILTFVNNADGVTSGVDIGATVDPTVSTEGSVTVIYTPGTTGLHILRLGVGSSGAFASYSKFMMNVVPITTSVNVTVRLP